jgi:uncharacterized membrane protein
MLSLLGILVVVAGFLVRLNPVLVVIAGAVVTGLAGGLGPVVLLSTLGKAFNDARYISLALLVLPVVGLLERSGLQRLARSTVARLRALTVGRLLIGYLALRQLSAALGLLSLGGQATMVRPLLAPMAEGVAETRLGPGSAARGVTIRAHAAGADNLGAFFGEDVFVALGSVLLIQAVLRQNHILVQPTRVALWAIPTAAVAFIIHAARLALLDRALARGAAR